MEGRAAVEKRYDILQKERDRERERGIEGVCECVRRGID